MIKPYKKSFSRKSGFSLLETIVAIGVLMLALLGPFFLASQALHAASVSKNRITAYFLAEEAMEYVRNRRDQNFMGGFALFNDLSPCKNQNGCKIEVLTDNISGCGATCQTLKRDSSTGAYGYGGASPDTIFIRKINVTDIKDHGTGEDEGKVTVTVSWTERFSNPSVTLETRLFRWR